MIATSHEFFIPKLGWFSKGNPRLVQGKSRWVKYYSRWWFQIYFHLYLGKIPMLINIFSDGLVQPPTSSNLTRSLVSIFPSSCTNKWGKIEPRPGWSADCGRFLCGQGSRENGVFPVECGGINLYTIAK